MASKILATLLQTHLGNFFEGINSDTLSLSFFKGNVHLQKLQVRPSAFDFLNLPVEVIQGSAGTVSVNWSWKQFASEPVIITVRDVSITLGPLVDSKRNQAELIKQKLRKELETDFLDCIERLQEAMNPDDLKKENSKLKNFGLKIAGNVQIVLENLKITFESGGQAVQVTVDNCRSFATNSNWEPAFIANSKIIHYQVALENICLNFSPSISADNWEPIISPVRISARLKINKARRPDKLNPRISADVNVDYVSAFFYVHHFSTAMEWRENIQGIAHRLSQQQKFASLRPTLPIFTHPRVWWRFAIAAVISELRTQGGKSSIFDPSAIATTLRKSLKYLDLYQKALVMAATKSVNRKQREELVAIETLLPRATIFAMRQVAEKNVERDLREKATTMAPKGTTESRLWGKFKSRAFASTPFGRTPEKLPVTPADDQLEQEEDEEERELTKLMQLDDDDDADDTHSLDSDYVQYRLHFSANRLTLGAFLRFPSAAGTLGEFSSIQISTDFFPYSQEITFTLGDVKVTHNAPDIIFPLVVARISEACRLDKASLTHDSPAAHTSLIAARIVRCPPDSENYADVSLEVMPLGIILSGEWVRTLSSIMSQISPTAKSALADAQQGMGQAFRSAKSVAAQKIRAAFLDRRAIGVSFNIAAPTFLIPGLPLDSNSESGSNHYIPMLVAKLGHLSLHSAATAAPESDTHTHTHYAFSCEGLEIGVCRGDSSGCLSSEQIFDLARPGTLRAAIGVATVTGVPSLKITEAGIEKMEIVMCPEYISLAMQALIGALQMFSSDDGSIGGPSSDPLPRERASISDRDSEMTLSESVENGIDQSDFIDIQFSIGSITLSVSVDDDGVKLGALEGVLLTLKFTSAQNIELAGTLAALWFGDCALRVGDSTSSIPAANFLFVMPLEDDADRSFSLNFSEQVQVATDLALASRVFTIIGDTLKLRSTPSDTKVVLGRSKRVTRVRSPGGGLTVFRVELSEGLCFAAPRSASDPSPFATAVISSVKLGLKNSGRTDGVTVELEAESVEALSFQTYATSGERIFAVQQAQLYFDSTISKGRREVRVQISRVTLHPEPLVPVIQCWREQYMARKLSEAYKSVRKEIMDVASIFQSVGNPSEAVVAGDVTALVLPLLEVDLTFPSYSVARLTLDDLSATLSASSAGVGGNESDLFSCASARLSYLSQLEEKPILLVSSISGSTTTHNPDKPLYSCLNIAVESVSIYIFTPRLETVMPRIRAAVTKLSRIFRKAETAPKSTIELRIGANTASLVMSYKMDDPLATIFLPSGRAEVTVVAVSQSSLSLDIRVPDVSLVVGDIHSPFTAMQAPAVHVTFEENIPTQELRINVAADNLTLSRAEPSFLGDLKHWGKMFAKSIKNPEALPDFVYVTVTSRDCSLSPYLPLSLEGSDVECLGRVDLPSLSISVAVTPGPFLHLEILATGAALVDVDGEPMIRFRNEGDVFAVTFDEDESAQKVKVDVAPPPWMSLFLLPEKAVNVFKYGVLFKRAMKARKIVDVDTEIQDVSLAIDALSIHLLGAGGQFGELSLDGFKLLLNINGDAGLKLGIEVRHMSLRDTRSGLSVFSTFSSSSEGSKPGEGESFSMSQSPDLVAINCFLKSANFTLYPSFLSPLLAFFSAFPPQILPPAPPSSLPREDAVARSTQIDANIGIKMLISTDEAAQRRQGISITTALEAGAVLAGKNSAGVIRLCPLEVASHTSGPDGNKAMLALKVVSGCLNKRSLVVVLPSIGATISFHQIIVIKSLLAAFSSTFSPLNADSTIAPTTAIASPPPPSLDSDDPLFEKGEEEGSVDIAAESGGENGCFQISFDCSNIGVCIQNAAGIDLFQLNFGSLESKITLPLGPPTSRELSARNRKTIFESSLSLSASFYNPTSKSWVQALKEWELALNFQFSSGGGPIIAVSSAMIAEFFVDERVAMALWENGGSMLDDWRSNDGKGMFNLTVENQSCMDLLVTFGSGEIECEIDSESSVDVLLDAFSSSPLMLLAIRAPRLAIESQKVLVGETPVFLFSRDGHTVHAVLSSPNKNRVCATRTLRLLGGIHFCNDYIFPLSIQVENIADDSAPMLLELEPGESVCVPPMVWPQGLNKMQSIALRCGPIHFHGAQLTSEFTLDSLTGGDGIQANVFPLGRTGDLVNVSLHQPCPRSTGVNYYKVHFRPPFTIHNDVTLPLTATVRVADTRHLVFEQTVGPGFSVVPTVVDPRKSHTLEISILALGASSSPFPLPRAPTATTIELSNASGGRTQITMEMKFDGARGGLVLLFASHTLVYNCTGMPLELLASASGPAFVGQGEGGVKGAEWNQKGHPSLIGGSGFSTATMVVKFPDSRKLSSPIPLSATAASEISSFEIYGLRPSNVAKKNRKIFEFGVEVTKGQNSRDGGVSVRLVPRVVFWNKTCFTLNFAEPSETATPSSYLTLAPHASAGFYWKKIGIEEGRPIVFKVTDGAGEWSPVVKTSEFLVCPIDLGGGIAVHAELKIVGATHVIEIYNIHGTFIKDIKSRDHAAEHEMHPPMYVLSNATGSSLFIAQKDVVSPTGPRMISSGERHPVALSDVHGGRVVEVFVKAGGKCDVVLTVNLESIGRLSSADGKYIAIVEFDGPIKVCTVSDSAASEFELVETLGSAGEMRVVLEGVSVVCSHVGRELAAAHLRRIQLSLCHIDHQKEFEFVLDHFQIDNMTREGAEVAAAPLRRFGQEGNPMFHVSCAMCDQSNSNIRHFKCFVAAIQELELSASAEWLMAVLLMVNDSLLPSLPQNEMRFDFGLKRSTPGDVAPGGVVGNKQSAAAVAAKPQVYLYCEYFHLHPVKLNVSFSLNSMQLDQLSHPLLGPLRVILRGVANIDEASIVFRSLQMNDAYMSSTHARTHLLNFYLYQLNWQIPFLLGGLNVLGDPIGLLKNCSSGLTDFFYEPVKGVVEGPRGVAKGMMMGTGSLVSHVIHGSLGSASKVVGAVGKALDHASTDKGFAMKQQQSRQSIGGWRSGMKAGATGLVRGVYGGVTGLVMEPIHGASSGGTWGFFKGVGKGVVGAVAKPASGVTTLTEAVLGGISKEAKKASGYKKATRLRDPKLSD